MQKALVAPLDSGLADVVGTAVIRKFAVGFELVDLMLIDAPDITHDVRENFAARVLPEQACVQINARESISVRGKARDFLVREPHSYWQAVEALAFLQEPLESPPIPGRDVDKCTQFANQRVQVCDPAWCDFERIGRIVVRENDTISIEDDAAVGRNRHDRNTVGLGEALVVLLHDDLEIVKARKQEEKGRHHETEGHCKA